MNVYVSVCLARLPNICFRCSWFSLPINVRAVNSCSTFFSHLAAFTYMPVSDESSAIWEDFFLLTCLHRHFSSVMRRSKKCRPDIISYSIQIMQKQQISSDRQPDSPMLFFSPFCIPLEMKFSYTKILNNTFVSNRVCCEFHRISLLLLLLWHKVIPNSLPYIFHYYYILLDVVHTVYQSNFEFQIGRILVFAFSFNVYVEEKSNSRQFHPIRIIFMSWACLSVQFTLREKPLCIWLFLSLCVYPKDSSG